MSAAELEELRVYEMAGKPEKDKSEKSVQRTANSKYLNAKRSTLNTLTMAECQRMGFEYADIAEADNAAAFKQNLSKYFERHPKLRAAFDRGRLLRTLSKTAPNCLIYEAARRLKDLGFTQFQTAQDLRNFLDKDREANEIWESARVNAAIDNRENLRKAAGEGNVKAIELLDKWTIDRQKETGESGSANFNRISTNQMAELFGVTRQTVYEWQTQKGLMQNKDGTFDLHSALQWFEDYILKKATRGNSAVSPLNPFQAVKTKREELKLEHDRGELLERGAVLGFQVTMMQNVVNSFNGITDLANRVFSQPREEIVARLEDFRDEVMAKLQHVPAELKLDSEAGEKLNELFDILKPKNTEYRIQETEKSATENTEKI